MSVTGTNPYGVEKGQVWEDADPRSVGRKLRILEVGETHATVQSPTGKGRIGTIRLNRFRPTSNGYRLIEAAANRGER